MAYTTINKSTDYFNINFTLVMVQTSNITGLGFQPDWVLVKTSKKVMLMVIMYLMLQRSYKQIIFNTNSTARYALIQRISSFR